MLRRPRSSWDCLGLYHKRIALTAALGYAVSPIRATTCAMELALNIAWLIVAAALLLLCGARALSFSGKRQQITALAALSCLIWLLFPVISITDDLNAGQPVLAAASVKKPAQPAVATGVLLPLPLLFPAPSPTGWRQINLHADLCGISQEYFAFDLSRRPPPQAS